MPSPKLRCSTAAVYAAAPDANYPPVFLYALWAIDRSLGEVPEWLVKALTIPFDLAVGGALGVSSVSVTREPQTIGAHRERGSSAIVAVARATDGRAGGG